MMCSSEGLSLHLQSHQTQKTIIPNHLGFSFQSKLIYSFPPWSQTSLSICHLKASRARQFMAGEQSEETQLLHHRKQLGPSGQPGLRFVRTLSSSSMPPKQSSCR